MESGHDLSSQCVSRRGLRNSSLELVSRCSFDLRVVTNEVGAWYNLSERKCTMSTSKRTAIMLRVGTKHKNKGKTPHMNIHEHTALVRTLISYRSDTSVCVLVPTNGWCYSSNSVAKCHFRCRPKATTRSPSRLCSSYTSVSSIYGYTIKVCTVTQCYPIGQFLAPTMPPGNR